MEISFDTLKFFILFFIIILVADTLKEYFKKGTMKSVVTLSSFLINFISSIVAVFGYMLVKMFF